MPEIAQDNSTRIRVALEAALAWVAVNEETMTDLDLQQREKDHELAWAILRKWREEEDNA